MITQRYKDQLKVNGLNKCFDVIFRPCTQRLEFGVPPTAVPQGPHGFFFCCLGRGCYIMITQRYKDQLRVHGLNKCFDVIFRPCIQSLEFGEPPTAVPCCIIFICMDLRGAGF
jgi:hypothetical protein